MKTEVSCPDCGWSVTVDSVHLGKSGRCKSCGTTFKLESPSPAEQTASDNFGLDDLPAEQQAESAFSTGIDTQGKGAPRHNRQQLRESELPPKIAELLYDDEEVLYAARPAPVTLIIKMILIGGPLAIVMLLMLLSMFQSEQRIGSAIGMVRFISF